MEMSTSSQHKKHPLTFTHPTSTGFTQAFQFMWNDGNFRQKECDDYGDSRAGLKAVVWEKRNNKKKNRSDDKIIKYKYTWTKLEQINTEWDEYKRE